ncbi:MAG: PaaI family thioesterase [Pseudomonadota bacterium]
MIPNDVEARVRAIAAGMPVLEKMGIVVDALDVGRAEMSMPFQRELAQHHGYQHAGITTLLADTTGGLAAATMMPTDSNVLSVEFKINLLAPARGDRFRSVGRVLRPGRTLTAVEVDVFADSGSRSDLIARLQQTCIRIPDRS